MGWGGKRWVMLQTIFSKSLTLCFWPDSEPTKLLHNPKQKHRRGGRLRLINTCRKKVPLQVNFFRQRHLELLSTSLIQGVTERCRLYWLTNSALVYEPICGGRGRVAGSQTMSTAVHKVTGAQINFGNLTPYLPNGLIFLGSKLCGTCSWSRRIRGYLVVSILLFFIGDWLLSSSPSFSSSWCLNMLCCRFNLQYDNWRVVDPRWFNADPDTDPDPAFFLIADPDSVLNPEFWWPKIYENLQRKKNGYFFQKKLQFSYR